MYMHVYIVLELMYQIIMQSYSHVVFLVNIIILTFNYLKLLV